jgi:AhpC/TSA family/Disulphide bond corrector protein DsbC
VELEQQKDAYRREGIGVAALSYDSAGVLKDFAARKGITYPLLSDPDSKVIRAFGILNQNFQPGQPPYGVPFPGMYIINEHGIVRDKFFEQDHIERYTAASILAHDFGTTGGVKTEIKTPHLTLTSSASDTTVFPGSRITLVLELDMKPGMHVYAPGVTGGYIPIDWKIPESKSWLALPVTYPPSRMLHMPVIDETVPVYADHVRIVRDVTIAQPVDPGELMVEGAFRYQACDDATCYIPQTIPLKWTLQVQPLDGTRALRSKP